LNYTGGKYKLLNQILPYFPKKINRFFDLFCGGCNIGVNVKANEIICNDIQNEVIELMNYFKKNSSKQIIEEIENIIHKYELSETSKYGYDYYGCNSNNGVAKYNKERYIKLRNDYNKSNRIPIMFYTVLIFAFNNQIRFNRQHEYKESVNKRDFNDNMRKNLIKFVDYIKNINIIFTNKDFRYLFTEKLNYNDFVYLDPPYLITSANYNKNWTEEHELNLLKLIDRLNDNGIRFALSNVLKHKGKENIILQKWCEKYIVNDLMFNYQNCNYGTINRNPDSSKEVLITNY